MLKPLFLHYENLYDVLDPVKAECNFQTVVINTLHANFPDANVTVASFILVRVYDNKFRLEDTQCFTKRKMVIHFKGHAVCCPWRLRPNKMLWQVLRTLKVIVYLIQCWAIG